MNTPDRIIVIPSPFMGGIDAALRIFSPDGETATISLSVALEIIARGHDFRRPQVGRWTWLDAPEAEVVATFGAFLAYALESSEDGARDGWQILTDAASDWSDALALYGDEESDVA
jgi:hypothetical protein